MWYVKKEHMSRLEGLKGFDECVQVIKEMVKEGNAVSMSNYIGSKSNLHIQMGMKFEREGYEFVYIDM